MIIAEKKILLIAFGVIVWKKWWSEFFVLVYLQGVDVPDWPKSSGFLRRPQKFGTIFLKALTLLSNIKTLFLWLSQDIWTLQHKCHWHLISLFGYTNPESTNCCFFTPHYWECLVFCDHSLNFIPPVSIFGRFALIWGYIFLRVLVKPFWGRWGQRTFDVKFWGYHITTGTLGFSDLPTAL